MTHIYYLLGARHCAWAQVCTNEPMQTVFIFLDVQPVQAQSREKTL